ncbi:endonuclease/exonuclease/phosphatase family protein [Aeromicrobium sp.]|uniref:endonuclease/exonuclease/phosphatase family protein n=1 Tax=Aeromicrobium sp. TaxID=1871063 RepID=UPI003C5B8146
MPDVPAPVAKEISALQKAVRAVVPAKKPKNLLIGSWNLRAFGDLTPKWSAAPKDSPKRDFRAVALIAAVLERFDVIAVQEVRRETESLRFLLSRLGSDWRVITTDVTEGDEGNGERLSFVYDSTRVQPSGLVGEIVLPSMVSDPTKQFARTPYAASFRREGIEFILTTVHIIWGKNVTERIPELTEFATWMRAWADRPTDWNRNLLVLGDFNIDRLGSELYKALFSTGLFPPAELNDVPRTIFSNDKNKNFYDQIAWFSDFQNMENVLTGLRYDGVAGSFDFLPHAFAGMTKAEVSWRISDHYPLWIEFQLD